MQLKPKERSHRLTLPPDVVWSTDEMPDNLHFQARITVGYGGIEKLFPLKFGRLCRLDKHSRPYLGSEAFYQLFLGNCIFCVIITLKVRK